MNGLKLYLMRTTANYHKWLTGGNIGASEGITPSEINTLETVLDKLADKV